MKALKEKRIRLRSLWRRGLVILSLFALVFASCNSSDAPEETTPPTTPPDRNTANVEILATSTDATQYEGTQYDTTGLKVKVTYDNGTDYTYDGSKKEEFWSVFEIKPKYIQGVILEDEVNKHFLWMPVTNYEVHWKGGEQVGTDRTPKVVPIQRKLVDGSGNTSFEVSPISGQFSPGNNSLTSGFTSGNLAITAYKLPYILGTTSGYVTNSTINFVGDLDLLNNGVRVDDPALTTLTTNATGNTGFRLQATYTDLTVRELARENTEARFITFYNAADKDGNDTNRDASSGTSAGQLLVSIANATDSKAITNAIKAVGNISFIVNGQDYWPPNLKEASINKTKQGKLTAMHYIPYVYNVDRIKVKGTTPYADESNGLFMYYWEPDDNDAWTTKLAKAELEVTYTGARPGEELTRTIPLATALSVGSIVWESQNPFNTTTSKDDYSPYNVFGVSGVIDTAAQAKKDNQIKNVAWDKLVGAYTSDILPDGYPAIRVNYRGAIDWVPVDIVTQVTNFQVSYKPESTHKPEDGGYFDMRWLRRRTDNDLGPGGVPEWDQEKFGKEFDAQVTLSSVRGREIIWKDLSAKAATQTNFAQGAGLAGPYSALLDSKKKPMLDQTKFYTTNFGDVSGSPAWTPTGPANTLDWAFKDASWGIAGIKKNGPWPNGSDKTVTFYYQPPTLNTTRPTTVTGKITNKLMKQTATANFRGIGIWVEYK